MRNGTINATWVAGVPAGDRYVIVGRGDSPLAAWADDATADPMTSTVGMVVHEATTRLARVLDSVHAPDRFPYVVRDGRADLP